MSEREETLVFPVQESRVWLPRHKRGKFEGLLSGYGGKRDPQDDSLRECACREFEAESGARSYPGFLSYMATIRFHRESCDEVAVCSIYFLWRWEGNFLETEEMTAPEAYPKGAIPYDQMLEGDADWLPKLLGDVRFRADVFYHRDWTLKCIKYHDC